MRNRVHPFSGRAAAVAGRNASAEGVESAEAMLDVARIDLDYTKVDAPIGGITGISKVRIGDHVSPIGASAVLDTIPDVDPIHVRFFLGEYEARERQTEPARASSASRQEAFSALIRLCEALGGGWRTEPEEEEP